MTDRVGEYKRLRDTAKRLQTEYDTKNGEFVAVQKRLADEFQVTPENLDAEIETLTNQVETWQDELRDEVEAYEEKWKDRL